jgi:hypothetical protein
LINEGSAQPTLTSNLLEFLSNETGVVGATPMFIGLK